MTLVCGPPCSGKSTWAREHRTSSTTVLDWDDMARTAGSTARWNHAQEHRQAAETRMQQAIHDIAQIEAGHFILIRACADPAERQRLAEYIRADEVVVLAPPRAVLYARANRRTVPAKVRRAIDRWLALNRVAA